MTESTIWAFGWTEDPDAQKIIFQSIQEGKSRFGYSSDDSNNLKLDENRNIKDNCGQRFLLLIKEGDWIVHINTPKWGECTAVKVKSSYDFDEGLYDLGYDFRHCFEIEKDSIISFDRNDPNISPTVQRKLKLMGRYWRINDKEEFFDSLKRRKKNEVQLHDRENPEEYHLKEKTAEYLTKITKDIHEMHRGKKLEGFLARVIRKIPGVIDVEENGSGWGPDYGADLIINLRLTVGTIDFNVYKIVVQVKSYEGNHDDLYSVDQIEEGIKKFEADAGLLITTAESTEKLERKIKEASSNLKKEIQLLSGAEVARFVLKHAPDLLFGQQ